MASKLPTFDQLMNPLLKALQALGGSGSIEEVYDKVVELEQFSDDVISQLHDPEKSNQTEVAYRLAWARTYLKKYGLLENSSRGVWSLNQKANDSSKVDPHKVVQFVRALDKKEKGSKASEAPPEAAPTADASEEQE
jgi:restriction system protein